MTTAATAPAPAAAPGSLPAGPDVLYDALCQRDPAFEGLFFACVRTTGIFCRPTCSARKPRRENVEFVATAQQALLAGYRPCRICHPLAIPTDAPDWLADLVARIQAPLGTPGTPPLRGGRAAPGAGPHEDPPRSGGLPTIRERELRTKGLDPDHVRRQFKRHCGMSLSAFQRAVRLGAALRAIREGATPTAAAMDAGYE
ncbi:MAG: Ada metal-binding domain-containing protein, partial [Phycisphaerales bacterium JB039]